MLEIRRIELECLGVGDGNGIGFLGFRRKMILFVFRRKMMDQFIGKHIHDQDNA